MTCEKPNLFQLRRRRGNRFTDFSKLTKFRIDLQLSLFCRVSGAYHDSIGGARYACCYSSFLQREIHLIFFSKGPCLHTLIPQVARKFGREPVESKYAFRLHKIDIANKVVVVSVIRERKRSVNLVAINCIRIDCPAADHCDPSTWNCFQHARPICTWWADENLPRNIIRVVDRKSTRLNSSHITISYAVFCL